MVPLGISSENGSKTIGDMSSIESTSESLQSVLLPTVVADSWEKAKFF